MLKRSLTFHRKSNQAFDRVQMHSDLYRRTVNDINPHFPGTEYYQGDFKISLVLSTMETQFCSGKYFRQKSPVCSPICSVKFSLAVLWVKAFHMFTRGLYTWLSYQGYHVVFTVRLSMLVCRPIAPQSNQKILKK